MYYIYGVSGPSVLIESTDSMIIAGDQPIQLHELQLLEGIDGGSIRVMDKVAPDWKRLAISLKFNQSKIRTIDRDHNRSEDACREMFMQWLDRGHDLAQPCTWKTLIKCLRRAALIDVANSLREILRQ